MTGALRSAGGLLWCASVALIAVGCDKGPDPDRPFSAAEKRLIASLSPVPALARSPGNRFADDERAAELGRKLFYDTRMSGNGKVACATCHQPQLYFTDGLPTAKGIGDTSRSAPTIIGSQWLPFVFWDGRKDSLWSQALGPPEAPPEHGFSRMAAVHLVGRHYGAAYEAIFGKLPELSDTKRFPAAARPVPDESRHEHNVAWLAMSVADRRAVNAAYANIGKAIEAFERKLLPGEAPFDRFAAGLAKGKDAPTEEFSAKARRGLREFVGRAGCVNCHNGPLLTDKGFHNLGLPKPAGNKGIDGGRTLGAEQVKVDTFRCGGEFSDSDACNELRFLDPRFKDFLGAFKTPSLRNVDKTAPYMHAGHFKSLREVVAFYTDLPGKPDIGHRDLVLRQIDSAVDRDALVAFLGTLTGPLPDKRWLSGE